jgi:2',3'-cyclic-nucleotide 2'-phosphodiesterase (5'-nucleotidase family)
VIDEAKAKGPTLVVDTGNALFRIPGVPDAQAKERADFIAQAMAQLGTQAMAAGSRDLSAGADFLRDEATHAHLKVLSANLMGANGKPVFPASTVITAGGTKVALVGVTAANVSGAQPPVAAALAEAKRLRPKVDLVVVLAAISHADALQLANEAGDAIDFVIQSGDSRSSAVAQRQGQTFVTTSGERGKAVGRLALDLRAKGPYTDLSEIERNKQSIKNLDTQIAEGHKRAEAADGGVRAQLEQTLKSFQQRRDDLAAQVSAATSAGGRTFTLEMTALTADVKDDPDWAARVAKIEPPPAPAATPKP